MGKFKYLFISQNEQPQDQNNIDPNELKGTLRLKGDCFINGESIFEDAKKEKARLKNIFGKKHEFPAAVEPHQDWEVEEFSTELWGTWLCVKMRLKTKVAIAEGNADNVTILKADLFTNGAIKNIMNVSFTNGGSGPVCAFYTAKNSASAKDKNAKFSIIFTSTGSAIKSGTEISANFSMPVALEYMNFPID